MEQITLRGGLFQTKARVKVVVSGGRFYSYQSYEDYNYQSEERTFQKSEALTSRSLRGPASLRKSCFSTNEFSGKIKHFCNVRLE